MSPRSLAACWATAAALLACACGGEARRGIAVPGHEGAVKSAAVERAGRRAYDGAPPVIPHEDFGIECLGCHTQEGMEVEEVGFAPPMPHETTAGLSAVSRCRQCHVFAQTDAIFVAGSFVGLRQDLRQRGRLDENAPPTIPHRTFMRENCAACHTGPAAREEIRTSHPERVRCRQCHVPVATRSIFRPNGEAP